MCLDESRSYFLSTSVSRLGRTGRDGTLRQVAVCVVVPVDDQATGVALEDSHGQRQGWLSLTAVGAGLRGREGALDHDEPAAVPGALVGELTSQLGEPSIEDRPIEPGFGGPAFALRSLVHVRHRQVLDHDRAMGLREVGGQLVHRVATYRGDSPVADSEAGFGARSAFGTGFPSCTSSLQA